MPELWPGARVEVRVPQPPRVVVEQPVPAATVIYSPAAQWRAAIAALQADIADEKTRAESAESALSDALGLETTARQNADTLEATTRGNADTTLQANITAEASTRAAADTALDGRMTTAESTIASLPATYGRPVSTDGTDSLPSPTGVGLEFVIDATGLDDIRMNGVSV